MNEKIVKVVNIRLEIERFEKLKKISDDKGIPFSILAKSFVVEMLKSYPEDK